eukprot:3465198-Alexandrium_andersonii.AAC.1
MLGTKPKGPRLLGKGLASQPQRRTSLVQPRQHWCPTLRRRACSAARAPSVGAPAKNVHAAQRPEHQLALVASRPATAAPARGANP